MESAKIDTKKRHKVEKERLRVKHDREMDAARLADTRQKNLKETLDEPC